jgi:hypothetical protein
MEKQDQTREKLDAPDVEAHRKELGKRDDTEEREVEGHRFDGARTEAAGPLLPH